MANHPSAQKRARQNEVQRIRNRQNMSAMKTAIKKVQEAIVKKDTSAADKLFIEAQSVIAKTRRKGSIHANNMARRISRLCLAINKMKAAVKG
jgi:small subunit ribosomal protein S20